MSEITIKNRIEQILTPIFIIDLFDLIDDDIDSLLCQYCNQQKIDVISFSRGDGYIQHNKLVLDRVQSEFLKVCHEITGIEALLEPNINRQGIIGRYLDDYHNGQDKDVNLYHYWNKFMCIDNKYREWGQPYFAFTEGKGSNRSLNDIPIIKERLRSIQLDELFQQ